MPRIYLSGFQQDSFSSPELVSSQTCSLMQTSINAEIVHGNMNQIGVVQILILTMLLFVVFRWGTQKRNTDAR